MSGEIELVNDGDGLSILGSQTDVERFMMSSGLDRALSRDLSLQKLWSVATTAGAVGQVGADAAASSGRWVKLTAESAAAVKEYGFMPSKVPGVSHAMVGKPGDIKQWIQVVQPTSLLSTPFALTALTSVMQQRAMQQQMDEIVEYLQQLDAKVDDILRGQKDAVLADMIGVDLIIEEAMIVRDEVGRASEVTWSKVQSTGTTIARTQAYALRQLDAIAEKLESQRDVGDVAKATRKAEAQVREWLAVLARTFQLQDGLAILELDRVLSTSPRRARESQGWADSGAAQSTRAAVTQYRSASGADGRDHPACQQHGSAQPVRCARRGEIKQQHRGGSTRLPRTYRP